MGVLLRIHPDNPPERLLRQAVEVLQRGGVIIYPTDTVYGLGCAISSKSGVERIARLKGLDPKKAEFACLLASVGDIGRYTVQVDTPTYKLLKRTLPGPYTFILNASREVPSHFRSKKRTVGIRVTANAVATALVERLGEPLLTTSLKHEDEILEYRTDPELIHTRWGDRVDAVIDGGYGGNVPSTVVDLTGGVAALNVLREGLGAVEVLEG